MKELLIVRFGISEGIDNKRRLKELKKCRKETTESIRLHATKFEYLLSLITEKYIEDTEITMFIQPLDKPETCLSLIALQAALNLTTLEQITNKAIEVEDRAKLQDNPELDQPEDDSIGPTPMDVDNFQKGNRHNKQKYKKTYSDHQPQPTTQLRTFDKDGNPVCDFCRRKHRTTDCDQYKKNSQSNKHKKHQKGIHNVETILAQLQFTLLIWLICASQNCQESN